MPAIATRKVDGKTEQRWQEAQRRQLSLNSPVAKLMLLIGGIAVIAMLWMASRRALAVIASRGR